MCKLFRLMPALFSIWVLGQASLAAAKAPCLPIPDAPPTQLAKQMSLQEAILLSLRYNPSVQSQALQRVVDKFSLRVAENTFELQYALTASGQYGRSVTNNIPIYSSGTLVTQTTSLKNRFGTQMSAQINNSTTTQGENGTNITLSVTQPLLQGLGPDVNLAGLRNAKDADYLSRLNVQNTLAQAVTTIIADYRQVVSSINQLAVLKMTLKNDEKTNHQLQLEIAHGKKAPAEAIQSNAAIAQDKLNIKQGENALAVAKQTLLNDIGLDPRMEIEVSADISIDDVSIPTIETSLQLGLANNFSYQSAMLMQKQNERNLLLAKDQARPSLNLTLSGTVGGGQGLNLSNLNNNENSQQNVQLELSVPINNLPQKQAVLQARVAIEQQKVAIAQAKRNLETQIINSITNLRLLQQQIELAEQARDLARRNLEVAKIKLNYGRVAMFEVNNIQTSLTSAEMAVINNKINYLNAYSQLQFLLGTTTSVWGIDVRDK